MGFGLLNFFLIFFSRWISIKVDYSLDKDLFDQNVDGYQIKVIREHLNAVESTFGSSTMLFQVSAGFLFQHPLGHCVKLQFQPWQRLFRMIVLLRPRFKKKKKTFYMELFQTTKDVHFKGELNLLNIHRRFNFSKWPFTLPFDMKNKHF